MIKKLLFLGITLVEFSCAQEPQNGAELKRLFIQSTKQGISDYIQKSSTEEQKETQKFIYRQFAGYRGKLPDDSLEKYLVGKSEVVIVEYQFESTCSIYGINFFEKT